VSLSPSLTEMLFAVGAGDQVVAVDRYSNFPAGTPMTDLSGFEPNVEAITTYEPDLVALASDRDGIVAALETVGIPTLLLERAGTVDDTYAQLRTLGAVTGHEEEAAALVDQLGADIDDLVARVPARDAPLRYFYEVSDDGHSATSETFVGSVLGLAGLASIADGVDDAAGGFPQLSSEYVLEQDPDLILLAHADGTNPTPEELTDRPGWSELAALRTGMVVALDPDIASRWGPRIVDLLAAAVDATAGTG
jgi:iron complex transport system substrate-binding protein